MLHHDHTFYTDKRELATLVRVASTDASRPAIGGVCFDPAADGQGRAWATDGHAAAVLDRDGRSRADRPVSLVAAELAHVCKLARTRDVIALRVGKPNGAPPRAVGWSIIPGRFEPAALLAAVQSGQVSDAAAVARGKVPTIDATPPPIDHVLPSYHDRPPTTAGKLAVNPALVASFFADASRLESARAVRVWLAGELDPMLVMFADTGRDAMWRYVVMPMTT